MSSYFENSVTVTVTNNTTPKIAIFYTGELRTICSTIQEFKKNILINENIHIFAVLQPDSNTDDLEEFSLFLQNNFNSHLKSLKWFLPNNNTFLNIKNNVLSNMNLEAFWTNYLNNSGSIVEYYQMYLAYLEMKEYEYVHNFKYDYILRTRCDVIFNKSLDILNSHICHQISKEEILERLYEIKNILNAPSIKLPQVICRLMNSLLNKSRIYFNDTNYEYISPFIENLYDDDDDIFINNLKNYIDDGNYLITLRANVVYFMKRTFFSKIYTLGVTYGDYRLNNDYYWFNSESQIQAICRQNNIDYYNSCTIKEDRCLYQYDPNDFYNPDGTIQNTNDFLFFIKRI